jgi:hypothetical protein
VPGLFERENQALFLTRLDFGEDIDSACLPHERGITHRLNVAPGEDLLRIQTNLFCQTGCD